MLSRIASKNLSAFIVWVPQLNGTYEAGLQASRLIDDPRSVHYWDGSDVTGKEFARVLGTPGPAWDVYLAYERGVRWAGRTPPQPTYWMQQLGMANIPPLNGSTFADHVRQLLQ